MKKFDQIFRSIEFWKIYTLMEVWPYGETDFNNHLAELKKIFNFKDDNKFELEFNCGDGFSIILEYKIYYFCEMAESETQIFLRNKNDSTDSILGWWDMARWHPLCISPEEFKLLNEFWQKNDMTWSGTEYPRLLLKKFIGFQTPKEVENFKKDVLVEFLKLNLEGFENHRELLIRIPFYGDSRYKWKLNDKLGWVYESENYNCYSIRNECHSKGEEGKFPFKSWRIMIEGIENKLNTKCKMSTDNSDWIFEKEIVSVNSRLQDEYFPNENDYKDYDEDLPF